MKKSNIHGMTLIEVIVSIAIMGIIAVAFLNIFASAYIGVVSAGKRTEIGYEAQKAIEESIISSGLGDKTIKIIFPDGPSIEILGSSINKEVNNGNQSINITTFIPNP